MRTPEKKITVKDISKALDVSASTVSRALKNSPEISQKTKELVWKKAKEMGYLPSIPVYMQKQKSKLILFLTDNLHSRSQQEIIRSAQEYLTGKGYFPLILFLSSEFKNDTALIKQVSEIDPAGIISLMENGRISKDLCKKFKEKELPLVSIGYSVSDLADVTVLPDISNGAYLAASHLLKRGVRNLLLISGSSNSSFADELVNGIRTAFSGYPSAKFNRFNFDTGSDKIKQEFDTYFNNHPETDGIITSNAETARKVYHYIQAKKINIPDDITLISFGSDRYKDLIPAKISAVEFPLTNLGMQAAAQMYRIISKKGPENKLIIEPVKLIIRSSSMKVS